MNDEQARQHLSGLLIQAQKGIIPWSTYFSYRDYYYEAGYDIYGEKLDSSMLYIFLGIITVLAILVKILDNVYF